MLNAGDHVRVTVAGTIGPTFFSDPVATITAQLVAQGILVESVASNLTPSLLDQVLEGDWLSTPYQLTLVTRIAPDFLFDGVETFARVVSKVVANVTGTPPQSTTIESVNGASQGQTAPSVLPSPSADLLTGISGKISDFFSGVSDKLGDAEKEAAKQVQQTLIILGVVVIGIVVLVAYGPNVKALAGRG